jgi:hypothetical protein
VTGVDHTNCPSTRLITTVSTVFLLAAGSGCDAAEEDASSSPGTATVVAHGIAVQSSHEAVTDDNRRLATELQVPIADVERAISFQTSFAAFQDEILERFPYRVAGTWVEPVPAAGGTCASSGAYPLPLRSKSKPVRIFEVG